jgi:two-component sensor histidine kinase
MPALDRLERQIRRKPGPIASVIGVALCVGVATALRLALAPWLREEAAWFPTYYPAVLLATLFLGWRQGAVVLLLSALAADYFFVPPAGLKANSAAALMVFMLAASLILATTAFLREALIRLNAAHERERHLNIELQHRVQNNLAVVQGLAGQAIRSAPDLKTFYNDFRGRLAALSEAHRLLSSGDWTRCELPDLPRGALEAFRRRGAIKIAGPPCALPDESCVPLVLALHELATNAVKHGALSASGGEVSLTWSLRPADQAKSDMILQWVERGGPPVAPPSRQGLGSRLLVEQPGLDKVQVDYAPEGVRCTLVVKGAAPLARPASTRGRRQPG